MNRFILLNLLDSGRNYQTKIAYGTQKSPKRQSNKRPAINCRFSKKKLRQLESMNEDLNHPQIQVLSKEKLPKRVLQEVLKYKMEYSETPGEVGQAARITEEVIRIHPKRTASSSALHERCKKYWSSSNVMVIGTLLNYYVCPHIRPLQPLTKQNQT